MRTTMPPQAPSETFTRNERILIVLEVLLAIGAYGGAAGLLTGTVDLGEASQDLPFASLSFAGWALLVVNGLLPTVVAIGALRRQKWVRYGHLGVGLALTGWIVVQVAFLGWPPHWLQIVYGIYGLAITALAVRHLRDASRRRAGSGAT